MDDQIRNRARKGILEAVDVQVREGDPPEVRRTMRRLEREGFSTEDARILIGRVLAAEMSEIVEQRREFDPQKYSDALIALPREIYGNDEF